MASSDYLCCAECERKLVYVGSNDGGAGDVLCASCATAAKSEARAQALEEAAALADQEAAKAERMNFTPSWAHASKSIATAIRELKKGSA